MKITPIDEFKKNLTTDKKNYSARYNFSHNKDTVVFGNSQTRQMIEIADYNKHVSDSGWLENVIINTPKNELAVFAGGTSAENAIIKTKGPIVQIGENITVNGKGILIENNLWTANNFYANEIRVNGRFAAIGANSKIEQLYLNGELSSNEGTVFGNVKANQDINFANDITIKGLLESNEGSLYAGSNLKAKMIKIKKNALFRHSTKADSVRVGGILTSKDNFRAKNVKTGMHAEFGDFAEIGEIHAKTGLYAGQNFSVKKAIVGGDIKIDSIKNIGSLILRIDSKEVDALNLNLINYEESSKPIKIILDKKFINSEKKLKISLGNSARRGIDDILKIFEFYHFDTLTKNAGAKISTDLIKQIL